MQDNDAREASEVEAPQDDGLLPTSYKESDADLEARIMEVITDNSVLVTVAEEQRGHLPTWCNPQDVETTETCHVPLCSTDEDD
eukprot:9476940-Pyramimonas_sp.AAC.1